MLSCEKKHFNKNLICSDNSENENSAKQQKKIAGAHPEGILGLTGGLQIKCETLKIKLISFLKG